MPSISLINIGNELLKGRVVNTNASETGALLRKHGFGLDRCLVIPDSPEIIKASLEAETKLSEVIIISGGLGPTKDDMTKHTLAQWFGTSLVAHEPTIAFIRDRFASRGMPLTETNRQQGFVPEGCEVLANVNGTAPGMLFQKGQNVVISLPGVPYEMRHILVQEVIPWLKAHFEPRYFAQRVLRIRNIPESDAGDRMAALEASLPPYLGVAYLPRRDGIWIELHAEVETSREVEALQALIQAEEAVAELFADKLYTRGDQPASILLGEKLKAQGLTLAIAESLTGGMIASKIVDTPGSSSYFLGSVTAYKAEIKVQVLGVNPELIDKYGVVSAEVAMAMAEGVRTLLGADIALSSTGFAESDAEGGQRPLAWIGYADAQGSKAQQVTLYQGRNQNRERAANYALILGFEELGKREH